MPAKSRAKTSPRPSPTTIIAAGPPINGSPNAGGREPLNEYVCQRVREMRKNQGWTLQSLSEKSGVSRSMLSQIERGTANPTLGVAFRIAHAFGITLGDLVDGHSSEPRIDVVRRTDSNSLFRDDDQCRIRTLSPLQMEKDVEFYELTLKAKGALVSAPHFEGTREFLTIEKGSVRLLSADSQDELQRGDSAHYPADVPHRLENIGRGEAVAFLVVIYPPSVPR
ncbi:MAG: XRE family transcriptional regulator [Pirellulaceae bacterium]|jgi:transcriptional regulator with XRE-family HTH domain|nr:XRE family transcriptional regulator [Pirellulaceae bacterium]HJN10382.1 XRE family transcriptional regulator [Pirellulaceae bacterium]